MKKSRILLVLCAWTAIGALAMPAIAPVEAANKKQAKEEEAKKTEPDRVVVQHILVGFKRSIQGKKITRTKKEAAALAEDLVKRARDGEDFLELVKEYTDDRPPGIIPLVNDDAPRMAGTRGRGQMVPGFGDMAFSLEVGQIGLVEYSFGGSPYGWHIVKRLE